MAKLKCLEKYFEANTEATYKRNIDGKLCLVSADKEIRVNTAKAQYEKEATPITTVINTVSIYRYEVRNKYRVVCVEKTSKHSPSQNIGVLLPAQNKGWHKDVVPVFCR